MRYSPSSTNPLLQPAVTAEGQQVEENLERQSLAQMTSTQPVQMQQNNDAMHRLGSQQVETGRPDKAEPVQLLERHGIASLLQLLFHPANNSRTPFHDILLNLCANRGSRIEILSQLLAVFHDITAENASVERVWYSITKRARSLPSTEPTSKITRKQLTSPNSPYVSASLLILQCLKALSFLIRFNQQVPSFFLVEHEVVRKSLKSKGKARDTVSRVSRFPINDLIASLSRSDVLKDTETLELLSSLISATSRPLLLLLRKARATTNESPGNIPMPGTQLENLDSEVNDMSMRASKRELVPPEIPPKSLRLIVNLIVANACSSRTFQHTLASINHLSVLHGARHIVLDELISQCQDFIPRIRGELKELCQQMYSIHKVDDIPRAVLANFSSSNSDQTKFLRVLKTLDYLEHDLDHNIPGQSADAARDHRVWLDAVVQNSIWEALGYCLTTVHVKQSLMSVATLLLPLIEALMVVCKSSPELESLSPRQNVLMNENSLDHSRKLFITFTDAHKSILNQMVRNSPNLMSGSFSLLTKNPKVLDFDNKRNFFTRKLREKGSERGQFPTIQLNVRRNAVFLDSYKDLHFKSGNEIKYSKLNIRFVGEEGVDAGGVSREWFQVLARQMFDPNYALFVPVNADRNTYHPNKTSGINPEHLLFFKFIGRIVGKALYDGRLLDCHFSRPIYCKMLRKNVTLKDMETLDLEYYKSLLWMLNNDITDVITETFAVERDDFGEVSIIDLIPNGRNIMVTEQNKQDYVARVTEYRLLESVSEQMTHFMIGFNEIIPPHLVAIFNEQELELLISGLPDIDPDDWKNNTEYHNYTYGDPQIQWFWRAVRSFDDEQRARLLQFCTGSSRLPIEGFANLEGMHGVQKFNIHRDYSTGARLPQTHTCFNQLDLPEYENYELLRTSILTAISEGNEGFGFA